MTYLLLVLCFSQILLACLRRINKSVTDVIENEFSIQWGLDLNIVERNRRESINSRILKYLLVLAEISVILILAKTFLESLINCCWIDLMLLHANFSTFLQLRNDATLTLDVFHVFPPWVRKKLKHDLFSDLLVEDEFAIVTFNVMN